MDLLNKLYSVNLFSEKNGLENMERLCALANNPQHQFKTVHIAGSNGKGSVSTKIAAGLQESGYEVGLFTSPHIDKFNERIKINGVDISDDALQTYLKKAFDLVEASKIPATYFEIVTLLAFLYYADQKVDYVVLEAGLGGRLDATNVCLPVVSVITSISLEHTEILGDTIEAITREKAGIIKPNVLIVIGPTVPESIIREKTDLVETIKGPFETFFEENNAVSRRAMEHLHLPADAIEKAMKATPVCRMQVLFDEVPIIRDGSHNPGAIKQLIIALKKKRDWSRFHVVCSFSSNKDIQTCLELLQPVSETMTLLRPTQARLASIEMMDALLPPGLNHTPATFAELKQMSRKTGYPILVTGSFYIDLKQLQNL